MIIAAQWKTIFQKQKDCPRRRQFAPLKTIILVLLCLNSSLVQSEHINQSFSYAEKDDCPQNQEVQAVHIDFTSRIVKNGRTTQL